MTAGVVLVLPEGRDDLLIGAGTGDRPVASAPPEQATSPEPVPAPPVPAAPSPPPVAEPITIAFAGDIHAVGDAGQALRNGLPTLGSSLADADLAVVNLETTITERGTPSAKEYNYRAPVSTLTSLQGAGVDVVSVANNHGMDYGVDGLRDTMQAAEQVGLPAVGIGLDEQSAYAPHVAVVRGQRVAVLGATQVLDSSLQDAWTAGPDKPGLASAKREERLVTEVARAREDADVVVVYLHWGRELDPCPLPRQQTLAQALVDAGADVVVGGHAHVLLGGGFLGDAYVDYGLGNFVFNSRGGETARSGVLTLTLEGRSVTASDWAPIQIRGGTPYLLDGEAAQAARADKDQRRSCTGLAAQP